ncbi:MAG: hypothetical protein JXM73_18570 [Anaerolineae bacterium]|nr:hypothetical protein [Anaerolineae bacterium]
MAKKLNRWVRSKAGMRTLAGILVAVLVVVAAGAIFGWWAQLGDLLRGTVIIPVPSACESWPAPEGGYTYMPTASETDAKMIILSGSGMFSFTDEPMKLWIGVPKDYASFQLGFFDGDTCGYANGRFNCAAGNWDGQLSSLVQYTLYADRMRDGKGTQQIATWSSEGMPNNAWHDMQFDNIEAAKSPCGHYFYRLEAKFVNVTQGEENFKLRSTGYLITGGESIVGLNGASRSLNDYRIVFPGITDLRNPPESTYDGDWAMKFYIPKDTTTLEIWDGDFDRGSSASEGADGDDAETGPSDYPPGIQTVNVNPEGVQNNGKGIPPDNNNIPLFRRGEPVWYEIIDPVGQPIYTNPEPSGTEEWERYVISTDPNVLADEHVSEIKAGWYTFHIIGLDLHNYVWLKTPYMSEQIPPPPCDATCPRTIGYWKNNVKKVLIDNKPNGVQESRASIELALDTVAEYSPLYRTGINLLDPMEIGSAVRLTDAEANRILQRSKQDYPGDNKASQTMLARALQQNLATWLNWGSGKICSDTYVVLNVAGGTFQGTVWQALQEAQTIILNATGPDDPALERAKDIADRINNGDCGEECSEDLACEEYAQFIPPADNPPPYDELPEAPDTEAPPPETLACTAPIHNQYNVENPTNNPFYGIKFEYQSGEEVKKGAFDVFQYVLPADAVAAMTSVQLEAKAGQNVGQAVLEGCNFAGGEPCAVVTDPDGYFGFEFRGATDNGDGTLTLTFYVINFTEHGLSHATFGLPAGVVPPTPTGSYQSEVCP